MVALVSIKKSKQNKQWGTLIKQDNTNGINNMKQIYN